MQTYVAFLRGINVGGNKKVPMAVLKTMMENMKFENVNTLLNSGNVVFEAPKTDTTSLCKKLEKQFEATFKFSSHFIVRTAEELQKLAKIDPFKGIKVTPHTRLYITFLSEKPKSTLKIPYTSPEKNFTILKVTNGEVCSVLTLNPRKKTPEAMNILEKEFGKNVTTRNWNTVLKLLS